MTNTKVSKRLIVTRRNDKVPFDPFMKCNGKECGRGKYVGGGSYLCPHNSLGKKFPELCIEWHRDNDKTPFDYAFSSNKKVKWICSKNKNCSCHVWVASANRRTNGSGCPFCAGKRVCEHENLATKFPHLADEYHKDNPLPMASFSPYSGEKVMWICSENKNCSCHVWFSTIRNRSCNGTGCPFCAGLKVCKHSNLATEFPHLLKEYHKDNPQPMSSLAPFSHEKVKWICSRNKNCSCHVWFASANSRNSNGNGCPFCAGLRVCKHFNLATEFPHLLKEYHKDNPLPMSSFSSKSGMKIKWVCKEGHFWDSCIYDRTRKDKRKIECPHCSSSKKILKSSNRMVRIYRGSGGHNSAKSYFT